VLKGRHSEYKNQINPNPAQSEDREREIYRDRESYRNGDRSANQLTEERGNKVAKKKKK